VYGESAAATAFRKLQRGEDAGEALDRGYDRIEDAISLGAKPRTAACDYLACLRELKRVAFSPDETSRILMRRCRTFETL
jgi:hypothetical protein